MKTREILYEYDANIIMCATLYHNIIATTLYHNVILSAFILDVFCEGAQRDDSQFYLCY